ncbi:hypothetical protein M1K46_05865 [Fictibacillus sp. WQ 8-8]|uniref:hypothetical protein n=1 Tax=unclassified Fictibacillus TaxID=2644029 RepID=UPI0008E4181D|nr:MULTISPECIES: hypothetical protein [unclassified Fictibacillus]MCQ6265188.1 hypothetical protein [Fictibacillus sp. WQ 8-8]MED2971874.1 hypothetical protein [Fictibacillus sp. B-59209]SFE80313.1 hypothetical protein SAMN05428981_108185 [Bacillus sp. OV194]
MTWLLVLILGIIAFALFLDWRRKKNNNNSRPPINPGAKPGESTNYMMGDNKYTDGGGS